MVEDAIDRRIEITVWRNGALVDVIAVPARASPTRDPPSPGGSQRVASGMSLSSQGGVQRRQE